jgi:hypothetical protein
MRKFGLHEHKKRVRLLTNNPGKVHPLKEAGFRVEQLLLNVPVTRHNFGQLLSRQRGLGHTFAMDLSALQVEGAIVPRTNGELTGINYDVTPRTLEKQASGMALFHCRTQLTAAMTDGSKN